LDKRQDAQSNSRQNPRHLTAKEKFKEIKKFSCNNSRTEVFNFKLGCVPAKIFTQFSPEPFHIQSICWHCKLTSVGKQVSSNQTGTLQWATICCWFPTAICSVSLNYWVELLQKTRDLCLINIQFLPKRNNSCDIKNLRRPTLAHVPCVVLESSYNEKTKIWDCIIHKLTPVTVW